MSGAPGLPVGKEARGRGESVAVARPYLVGPQGQLVLTPPPVGEMWVPGGWAETEAGKGLSYLFSGLLEASSLGAWVQETVFYWRFLVSVLSPVGSPHSVPLPCSGGHITT